MSKDRVHIQASEKFRKGPSIVLCGAGGNDEVYVQVKRPKGGWDKGLDAPNCETCILGPSRTKQAI